MAELMPHQVDSSELVPAPATGVQPNQWLWIAWQRWPWIIVGLTIGLTGGAFYLHQSKPVYRSTAQVFVIRKHPEVLTTVMGQDTHQPLEDYLSSHLLLIKSPANIGIRRPKRAAKRPPTTLAAMIISANGRNAIPVSTVEKNRTLWK